MKPDTAQRLLPLVPQVPLDDLEEKGNTEVMDTEEETDDECSNKGAIATQSTKSQFLATEEHIRSPPGNNYETSQERI